jgi:aminoglycoside 2'-N-acetyltransferase I
MGWVPAVMSATTAELEPECVEAARKLMTAAFGERFSEHDRTHALGGVHFMVRRDGRVIAHGSVVERRMQIGDHAVSSGYVEAVAVMPEHQRTGLGTAIMRAAAIHIGDSFAIGVLSSSAHSFYERLGWQRWLGPTYVRRDLGRIRTPDEDAGIMILKTNSSPDIRMEESMTCEWREGNVW